MATLEYVIQATSRSTGTVASVTPVSASITISDDLSVGSLTVTQSASVAVPLGNITTPWAGYFSNTDSTNFIKILNGSTEIARVPAGQAIFFVFPSGITLNAQADTADCDMDFTLYEL